MNSGYGIKGHQDCGTCHPTDVKKNRERNERNKKEILEGTAEWLATRFEPEGGVMSVGRSIRLPSANIEDEHGE